MVAGGGMTARYIGPSAPAGTYPGGPGTCIAGGARLSSPGNNGVMVLAADGATRKSLFIYGASSPSSSSLSLSSLLLVLSSYATVSRFLALALVRDPRSRGNASTSSSAAFFSLPPVSDRQASPIKFFEGCTAASAPGFHTRSAPSSSA